MSNYMNAYAGKVITEPELRATNDQIDGLKVSFRMKVSDSRTDQHGNWEEFNPCYFTVECWGSLAERVRRSIRLGTNIIVIGRIVTDTWETSLEDGNSILRSRMYVKAHHIGPDMRYNLVSSTKRPQLTGPLVFSDDELDADGLVKWIDHHSQDDRYSQRYRAQMEQAQLMRNGGQPVDSQVDTESDAAAAQQKKKGGNTTTKTVEVKEAPAPF